MVLFGDEFDADERAEVGGGLRFGEGYEAIAFTVLAGFTLERREENLNDSRRT
jgi:hypothetical protein